MYGRFVDMGTVPTQSVVFTAPVHPLFMVSNVNWMKTNVLINLAMVAFASIRLGVINVYANRG